jgi:hypothetical protein
LFCSANITLLSLSSHLKTQSLSSTSLSLSSHVSFRLGIITLLSLSSHLKPKSLFSHPLSSHLSHLFLLMFLISFYPSFSSLSTHLSHLFLPIFLISFFSSFSSLSTHLSSHPSFCLPASLRSCLFLLLSHYSPLISIFYSLITPLLSLSSTLSLLPSYLYLLLSHYSPLISFFPSLIIPPLCLSSHHPRLSLSSPLISFSSSQKQSSHLISFFPSLIIHSYLFQLILKNKLRQSAYLEYRHTEASAGASTTSTTQTTTPSATTRMASSSTPRPGVQTQGASAGAWCQGRCCAFLRRPVGPNGFAQRGLGAVI